MAKSFELEINGAVHVFKAGFAFVRAAEATHKQKQNGLEQEVGLNLLLSGLYDGDVMDLLEALYLMNSEDPNRLKKSEIEIYLEDCEDIDKLFEEVIDFLLTSSCTKTKLTRTMAMLKIAEAQQKASLGQASTGNA